MPRKTKNLRNRQPVAKKNKKPRLNPHVEALRAVALMVSNPCSGPLVNYSIDGGVVERVRSNIDMATYMGTQGYILILPSYTGHSVANIPEYSYNILRYVPANVTTPGLNTAAVPMGSLATTAGQTVIDPASALITATSAFGTVKTLAACLTVKYIGTADALAGEYAMISNINLDSIFPNRDSGLPDVETMFNYAGVVHRIRDEMELRYRPTQEQLKYRTTPDAVMGLADTLGEIEDTVMVRGTVASSASRITCSDSSAATCMVFAWRGLASTSLVADFTKIIELRIKPASGFIERPLGGGDRRTIVNVVPHAVALLDKHAPGWQTAIGKTIESGAAWLLSKASKYVGEGLSEVLGAFSFLGF